MQKSKLISVIIPTYNSKKFVKNAIDSVLKQTYRNFEIIIVDDCSTDGTIKYINEKIKSDKIRIFKTKKNSGTVAHPRNIGLKECKGSLVCFLDSDDYWEKNKLQNQIECFKNHKTIYFSAAKYFNFYGKKSNFFLNFTRKFLQQFIIKRVNKFGHHWFYLYNPVIVSSALFSKEIFTKVSFDENRNSREDYDLWIRLRKANHKFHFINSYDVNICRREHSMSSNLQKELVTTLNALSNVFFKINNFSKLNYFLIGIILKFFNTFIKLNKSIIIVFSKRLVIFFISIYFLIFYSPLFWYLGKPLLYFDKLNDIKKIKNVVIFSGHGDTSYYNQTYQYRYKDFKKFSKINNNIDKIFILGRLQEIPEQKILESLLLADGINKNQLNVIYKEYNNTYKNIKEVDKLLLENGIKEVIFITSPYHSKRAKLLWSRNSSIDVKFLKGNDWPKKNNFFEYSKNKKIIIYEHLSIFYNKLKGNI